MAQGINSSIYDSYPTLARNNNIYFNSDRVGGKGGMDIYVSYYVDGKYQNPINLKTINSPDVENDLVVDPDERFIISNKYIAADKSIDLYISHKRDGVWSKPQKLPKVNTSDKWKLTPTLSPDGEYFSTNWTASLCKSTL